MKKYLWAFVAMSLLSVAPAYSGTDVKKKEPKLSNKEKECSHICPEGACIKDETKDTYTFCLHQCAISNPRDSIGYTYFATCANKQVDKNAVKKYAKEFTDELYNRVMEKYEEKRKRIAEKKEAREKTK